MTAGEIAQHFKAVKSATGWTARCPAHEDAEPSLSITEGDDGRTLMYCHAGCVFKQIVGASGLKVEDFFPPKSITPTSIPTPKALTVAALATSKGFTVDFLQSLDVEQSGVAVKITYRLIDGSLAPRHQLRSLGSKHPWAWTAGAEAIEPYGAWRLADAKAAGYVILVEGASDCWSGWARSVPVLGIPGALMAKVLRAEHLAGIPTVYVVHEPDEGGDKFVAGMTARLHAIGYTGYAAEIQMPDGLKDLNDLHRKYPDPEQFKQRLQAAIHLASPLTPLAEIVLPAAFSDKDYAMTSLGNRDRLVDLFGAEVAYVHELGWVTWTGERWKRDPGRHLIQRRAELVVEAMHGAADLLDDEKEQARLHGWATACENRAKLTEMIELAETRVLREHSAFDAHKMLLNVANGTLSLTNQAMPLRPHDKADLLTAISLVTFDPTAAAPTWEQFISDIMLGRQELIAYLQRLVGYILTADTSEHAFFIFHGSGANGKSTLLNLLRALLGLEYAKQTPASTFLAKKHEGVPNDLARLRGSRLVTAVEVDANRRLSEALVKGMTGGDAISARFLFKEFFEFQAEHKIVIACNHKPRIQGTDNGMWRRIHLVPFEASFLGAAADKDMAAKLLQELPGILNWAIAGCVQWQRSGLNPPEEVVAATEAYRQEEDMLNEFFADRCVFAKNARASAADLYAIYKAWADESGQPTKSKKEFGGELAGRGLERKQDGHGRKVWHGIGLGTADTADTSEENVPQNNQVVSREAAASGAQDSGGTRTRAVPAVSAVPKDSGGMFSPARHVPSVPVMLDTSLRPYEVTPKRLLEGMLSVLDKTDPLTSIRDTKGCVFKGCPIHDRPDPPWPIRSLRRADNPEMAERLARAFPDGRPLPLPDSAEESEPLEAGPDPEVPAEASVIPGDLLRPSPSATCGRHPITPRPECPACQATA